MGTVVRLVTPATIVKLSLNMLYNDNAPDAVDKNNAYGTVGDVTIDDI